MKTTKNTDLPKLQKDFMNHFDGTLESVLNFDGLEKILAPAFSAHYFYVSGKTPETTVTKPVRMDSVLTNEQMRAYGSKISQVRSRAVFVINGEIFQVRGMKL